MGIMDKLMFWKKKDDFADLKLPDVPKDQPVGQHDFGAGQGAPGASAPGTSPGDTTPGLGGTPSLGERTSAPDYPTNVEMTQPGYKEPEFDAPPPRHGMAPAPAQSASGDMLSKDIEVLSSKMDALKASIETINQRLANMEQYMREQKRRGGW